MSGIAILLFDETEDRKANNKAVAFGGGVMQFTVHGNIRDHAQARLPQLATNA
jgi:hypothetical protein